MRWWNLILLTTSMIAIVESKTLPTADNADTTAFTYKRPDWQTYQQQRKKFIQDENKRFLGADLTLSENERIVNEYLMKIKQDELEQGFVDPFKFIPSRHFFEMVDQFPASKLFQLIRQLPKGGVLHAHGMALGSVDLIVEATRWDHLWQQGDFESGIVPKFLFSKQKPYGDGWQLVSDLRKNSCSDYDSKIRQLFLLNCKDPSITYKSINDVWKKFENMFTSLKPIITFEPVWRWYYAKALQEFYDDNVNYLEFRGVLPELYDIDGKKFGPMKVVEIYKEETEKFKKNHKDFIDAKFIYAPIRFYNDSMFNEIIELAGELYNKHPKFVIGFDLVGQEDTGRSLLEFAPKLLELPPTLSFFFHAGETNWYGRKTDQNLIDAILLGTKRIGHGFALIKHPDLLAELKRRKICVEINPISNQVLKLVDDYRNHPAALLFSDNYPVVVSSDDPSFWGATPLSHDFYLAFLGIASAQHDLRMLKKLALNSIEFSAMDETEKKEAMRKWNQLWDDKMKELVESIKETTGNAN